MCIQGASLFRSLPRNTNLIFRLGLPLSLALGAALPGPAQGQQRPRLVLQALDLNHDGILSADEIQAAPKSLLVLDTNGDGQLSFVDELTQRRQDAGANPDQMVEQLMKSLLQALCAHTPPVQPTSPAPQQSDS